MDAEVVGRAASRGRLKRHDGEMCSALVERHLEIQTNPRLAFDERLWPPHTGRAPRPAGEEKTSTEYRKIKWVRELFSAVASANVEQTAVSTMSADGFTVAASSIDDESAPEVTAYGCDSNGNPIRGSTEVVNRTAAAGNALGNGWSVPGLDQIVMSDGQPIDGASATAEDTATSAKPATPYRLAQSGAAIVTGAALIRSDNSSAFYTASAGIGTVANYADDSLPGTSSSFTAHGTWIPVRYGTGSETSYYGTHLETDPQPGALNGDYQYTTDSGDWATWSLANLQPGKVYELFATWTPGPDRATDAQYVVNGATPMDPSAGAATTITVDQRYVPGETSLAVAGATGVTWRSLGFYVAGSNGTITVKLTSGDDGVTVADAVAAVDDWQLTTPAGSFNTLQTKNEGFVLRDKYGTIETFNAVGMVTADVDRLGNQTQYAYDSTENPQQLSTVTEQGGLVTIFEYGGGALSAVVDGYGRVTTYNGGTVTLPAPGYGEATPVWTFSYNGDELLSEIHVPNGNETDLIYDSYDRLSQVNDGVGATNPNPNAQGTTGTSLEATWTLQSGLSDVLDNSDGGSSPATSDDLDATYTTYGDYDDTDGESNGGGVDWIYGTDNYGYETSLTKPTTTPLASARQMPRRAWPRPFGPGPATITACRRPTFSPRAAGDTADPPAR